MHARNFLLFASVLLPVIGAPVATKESNSIQQRSANVLSQIASYVSRREPLLERIPAKAVSDIVFETKRDADKEDTSAIDGLEEEEEDLEFQGGSGAIDERAVRGAGHTGGRSLDERAVRGAGHKGGRSLDERAVRGPGYKGGRSLEERAVRGAGHKGGRSLEERAVRGAGYKGGRSLEERAVRGAGHTGGRRSLDERLVQDQ